MLIQPIKTKIFNEGENLSDFVRAHVKSIPERSIIVITSKIVALSERRVLEIKNNKTKVEAIKKESDWAIKTKYTWLTIKDGVVMASAGIDESNAHGKLILLPDDSFKAAARLRAEFKKHYRVKNLGVLITDSRLFPLRSGVVGVALGYAGFKGIHDDRGKPDLFGRKIRMSQTDVADSLATSSVLVMGEAAERQPLALIKNAPVEFSGKVNPKELLIRPKDDIYVPIFSRLKKAKKD